MKLPDYVQNCIELLEKSGFSAYAVGGAVRDSLIGVCPNDWDVTTSARPEETLEVFKDFRTIPTGIKHGTVTVLFDNGGALLPIEVTTFRVDGNYLDSRHPESVSFSRDVRDDLSRRDFTVNAMAYSEREGLIDAFGGSDDLKNRIIRTVGDAEQRFSEDALRILRAFRFSAQLGFEIEEKTLLGAKKCAHLLKNIARERIGAEFKKLIASDFCAGSLEKMIENDVWEALFFAEKPETDVVLRLSSIKSDDFAVRLAVLINEFSNDEKSELLNSLRLSNDEKKRVLRLSRVKDFDISGEKERKAREFLHLYRDILPPSSEVLRFYFDADEFLAVLERESTQSRPLAISDLAIKGGDVLPFVGGEHRRVGEILNMLLERVIDDPSLNEREVLIEMAKKSLE